MMQFWLSYNNNAERLWLPVNPDSISISFGSYYDDININQLGEYTVIGSPQAATFNFSSFFPAEYDESYCEYADFPSPWDIVQTLNTWKDSKKPCRLTITGTNINFAVTIRNFEVSERAGAVGDLNYSLSLKEYRFINVQTVDTSKPVVSEQKKRPPAEKPTTTNKVYVVKSGDTLWKIAQKQLGNGSRWQEIYNKNKSVIGGNPNKIKPGQKLTMP